MKKITIITGHYGAGKTNISVNYAFWLNNIGKKVTIIDMDIVNLYFRTTDFENFFISKNIELIKPLYANTNLDIPAINFDLDRIVNENSYIIIDVGGDDVGATAIGRFSSILNSYKSEIDMLYIINCYRYMTKTADEAVKLMYEIEMTSHLKHTGIINNSNLGIETTPDDIFKSQEFADEISKKTGLPIIFTAYKNSFNMQNKDKYRAVEIYVKPIWEN